jgi:hypothetical protein
VATFVSATTITCASPPQPPMALSNDTALRVQYSASPSGRDVTLSVVLFRYYQPPTVTAVWPNSAATSLMIWMASASSSFKCDRLYSLIDTNFVLFKVGKNNTNNSFIDRFKYEI